MSKPTFYRPRMPACLITRAHSVRSTRIWPENSIGVVPTPSEPSATSRFIICGDGEADPHLQFNGLANAIRMAQIDFGVIVEMEGLDEIRAGKQSYAVGKIRYSQDRIGWLLYLKQSLHGDASLRATLDAGRFDESSKVEDSLEYDAGAYIAEYKARNPDFPHQSTGDQFFDEEQFEATRAVGYNVAYRTLIAST